MELGMIGLGRMGTNMSERLRPISQALAPARIRAEGPAAID